LNLDPNDNDGDTDVADGRFQANARIITVNMNSRTGCGGFARKIQDNSGSANNGIVSPISALVAAIASINSTLNYEFDNTENREPISGLPTCTCISARDFGWPARAAATGILRFCRVGETARAAAAGILRFCRVGETVEYRRLINKLLRHRRRIRSKTWSISE
jgi:hypothetical protein